MLLATLAWSLSAATTRNDDSCDISALPAATLLLPYFEVDLTGADDENTLFTITNVTQNAQIARVTLWTDWAFPVLSFNIFLTGYDVQSISLRDVVVSGVIAPPNGTSSNRVEGLRSRANNANSLLDLANCASLAVTIPASIREDVLSALSIGRSSGCGSAKVGGEHGNTARGFATIDVVRSCGATMPIEASYFTSDLLYDNVLVGDYQQVSQKQNFAQGGTLVHIRAIPEGGAVGTVQTSFDRTFYSRLQNGATTDRRQPLPSSFAARWIAGGTGSFNASFKIWRDATANASCNVTANGAIAIAENVRFDEDENPVSLSPDVLILFPPIKIRMPAASRVSAADTSIFPPNPGGDVSGWMYMNFDDDVVQTPAEHASQSWVIVSMAAEQRYSLDTDATSFGNGCSPAPPKLTSETDREPAIAPAPNTNQKSAALAATTNNDDSCDITVAPAATLLLPYFEVDPTSAMKEDTIFTVTNVARLPQIARVTVWTDRSYPILTFNLFLTGYDVQTISLRDVVVNGVLAPPQGTSSDTEEGQRSASKRANTLLDLANCNQLAFVIPPSILADVRNALTNGHSQACPLLVGNNQPDGRARGFVTIDLVANCGTKLANEATYFTGDLLFDNVLTGDYQQVDRQNNFAQGGSMVHVRAIPEGGAPGAAATNLPRTFYGRYQNGGKADRRQPLPSTFAARWISGGPGEFNASFKIWREAITAATPGGCFMLGNASVPILEMVRFDEDENPVTFTPDVIMPPLPPPASSLPSTSNIAASNTSIFPPNPGGDLAGWIYLNLDNDEREGGANTIASQNWVVVSLRAQGRFSVDFDAPALGNGCSAPVIATSETGGPPAIGPAPNGRTP